MGFSLKEFFRGLQALITDPDLSDSERVEAVETYLVTERQYAEDCGLLKD